MKKVLIIALALSLTACNSTGIRPVHTIYKDKLIPVAVVPMPPEVKKPILATTQLTEQEKHDLGALVKAYVVENEQLSAYSKILESIVAEYKRLAIKSTDGYELVMVDGKVELRKVADK